MAMAIRDQSGTARAPGEIKVRDAGNTQRIVQRIYVRSASGLKQIYQRGIRLAASSPFLSGKGTLSKVVTVSVAGGTPPYTHVWTMVSQAGAILTPTTPNSASTSFRTSAPNGDGEGTARDTVTDYTGLTATIDVPVELLNSGNR